MIGFVMRRLGQGAIVLWAVLTITFAATFLSPVDPAASYAGQRATTAEIEAAREKLGLNDSIAVQYFRYLGRVLGGDLGRSFVNGQDVLGQIVARLPATAVLAAAALAVQVGLGVPLGIVAALWRRRLPDRVILVLSLVGVAAPAFVTGFVLLYVFAFRLGWFPLGGAEGILSVVLPALTLGLAGAAWYARMLRSAALNILGEDFIRAARAKGLSPSAVVFRHLMPNAIGPIVTMIGLDLGVFLGGVLVIEKVFAWPGIGLQAWRGIEQNDIPIVLGTVLFAAFCVTLLNLLADIANRLIDPRTRHG